MHLSLHDVFELRFLVHHHESNEIEYLLELSDWNNFDALHGLIVHDVGNSAASILCSRN